MVSPGVPSQGRAGADTGGAPSGAPRILAVNCGSSSLKLAVYECGPAQRRLRTASVERIGLAHALMTIKDADGKALFEGRARAPDHAAAIAVALDWLAGSELASAPAAIGHRVVHGGPVYDRAQRLSPAMLSVLRELVVLAPDHLPYQIDVIEATGRAFPEAVQIACFDTAFHRDIPELARALALPRTYARSGVVRYGFHGLSYEYIVQELRRQAGEGATDGRLVIAHLGGGASMAAVRDGRCVDTTMGLTPAGGMPMGTRSGDLDPGVLVYLLEQGGLQPSEVNDLVNHRCGLLGLSGISPDMRELVALAPAEPRARLAVEVFCYQARKHLAAMTATLGGLDSVVFTGGIGAHSAPIRQRICTGLEFLGIRIDERRNKHGALIVSAEGSPVTVRAMATDEALMIARHTYELLRAGDAEVPDD